MKKILALVMVIVALASMSVSVSANTLTFSHGNNNTSKKCFAQTEQTGNDSIGAKIKWQLSGSNATHWGPQETGDGQHVTSYSDYLGGYSGQSYGYFYHNGTKVWESTAWYSFSF